MYDYEGKKISAEELPEFEKMMDGMANNFYNSARDMYYFYDEEIKQKMSPTDYYKMLAFDQVHCGNLHALKWLINYRKTPVNSLDENDNTLLMLAAKKGHLDIVEWLLDQDVDIDAVNKKGNTAGELAQENNHHEATDLIAGKMVYRLSM